MRDTQKRNSASEELISAAEKLFTEKGYLAVSTRELADAAGVNLGAIQYHFGSKATLFLQTIERMMQNSSCMKAQLALRADAKTPQQAMESLGYYIHDLLHYMLRPEGPQACRLVFREVLSETSKDKELFDPLIASFVEQFIRPVDEKLHAVLKIISPQLSNDEIKFTIRSIVGQCSFYVSHQPFIERLDGKQFSESPHFEDAVTHIFRFTLRSLGVDEESISLLIPRIFAERE